MTATTDSAVFQMPLLTEQEILFRRKRGYAAVVVIYLVLFLAFYGVCQVGGPTRVSIVIVLGMAFAVISWLVMVMLINIDGWAPGDYRWLSQQACGALADLCEEEPGLQPYRDAVRTAGRQFTVTEFWRMTCWAAAQKDNRSRAVAADRLAADCKRLYGVAQASD